MRLLPLGAIAFAFVHAARLGFVSMPPTMAAGPAATALLALLGVELLRAVMWHRVLGLLGIDVSARLATVSHFRTILTKYIPGKVWTILSRASVVCSSDQQLVYCSLAATLWQIIATATGVVLGVLGLFMLDTTELGYSGKWVGISVLAVAGVVVLVLILGRRKIANVVERTRLLRERLEGVRVLPTLGVVIVLSLASWLLLGVAYWLFFRAIAVDIGPCAILLQPLANNIGVLIAFAPAGLGVREGATAGYLVCAGVAAQEATTAAVAVRILSFAEEVVVFVIGVLLGRSKALGGSGAAAT